MKVLVYTGITLIIYALASADTSNLSAMEALRATSGEYLNLLLIGLGIAQVSSILCLIKPKTANLVAAAEITLLISSLLLVLNSQVLFVMGNLVLMFLSKRIFAEPAAEAKNHSVHAKANAA
ncbi:MAG: hypothetical protein KTR17_01625 [Cellvibrionaceae bacterium]|nr:hypothetical protein [Cellvibrionaceae bacterium]